LSEKAEKSSERLWCPVRKRHVADRPEERIRQAFIQYLLRQGYPLSALQVEYQVGEAGRFDVAVFTRTGDVWLLVECKQRLATHSVVQVLSAAQAQLRRYATALGRRWTVYYLGLVVGSEVYYMDYTTGTWLHQIPPYPQL
jgi:hypothetical protein